MRCPRCSFTSFDHNEKCPKCGKDLIKTRELLGLIPTASRPVSFIAGLINTPEPGEETGFEPDAQHLDAGEDEGGEEGGELEEVATLEFEAGVQPREHDDSGSGDLEEGATLMFDASEIELSGPEPEPEEEMVLAPFEGTRPQPQEPELEEGIEFQMDQPGPAPETAPTVEEDDDLVLEGIEMAPLEEAQDPPAFDQTVETGDFSGAQDQPGPLDEDELDFSSLDLDFEEDGEDQEPAPPRPEPGDQPEEPEDELELNLDDFEEDGADGYGQEEDEEDEEYGYEAEEADMVELSEEDMLLADRLISEARESAEEEDGVDMTLTQDELDFSEEDLGGPGGEDLSDELDLDFDELDLDLAEDEE